MAKETAADLSSAFVVVLVFPTGLELLESQTVNW
jgi:hypothetical protein